MSQRSEPCLSAYHIVWGLIFLLVGICVALGTGSIPLGFGSMFVVWLGVCGGVNR